MITNRENQADIDFFLRLEIQVWETLISGDANADDQLLTDDFWGVYGTGFAEKSEHVGQLVAGPMAESYSLSQARLRVLCEGVVLLSYKAQWIRSSAASSGVQELMYISSIWKRCEGVWRNIFSQDTIADV